MRFTVQMEMLSGDFVNAGTWSQRHAASFANREEAQAAIQLHPESVRCALSITEVPTGPADITPKKSMQRIFLCRSGTREATVTLVDINSLYHVDYNDEAGSRRVGTYDRASFAISYAVFCVWGFYLHDTDIR